MCLVIAVTLTVGSSHMLMKGSQVLPVETLIQMLVLEKGTSGKQTLFFSFRVLLCGPITLIAPKMEGLNALLFSHDTVPF